MKYIQIQNNKNSLYQISKSYQSIRIDNQTFNTNIELNNVPNIIAKINGTKFDILFLKFDESTNKLFCRINGKRVILKITPQNEVYLKKIGIEVSALKKVAFIKSPMPGLILNINVSVGQKVEAGDPLLTLVAMKMENVIKSPNSGVIKEIPVSEGLAVDKGAVLIQFE